jgi:predicted dehydrogenase
MENGATVKGDSVSRRGFLKRSAAVSLATFAGANRVHAAGSDVIRVGLVGCGDRGTADARHCLRGVEGVELTAMADLFQDRLDGCLARLSRRVDDKVSVTPDTCFTGFDACEKLLETDVDVVILAEPPHFRPAHLRAAIDAGKHIFVEKPVAVDPVGVRSIIASGELAGEKGLSVVAGTQQRRMNQYIEVIKRVHAGQIGRIVTAQCYWHWGNQDWHFHKRRSDWSDMEWQVRCWPYFSWLSGDHIVEQHVHNLDIVNWAMGSHPVQCLAVGGRQVRTGPEYGNIFDHFAVEYEYPGQVRVLSVCSQMKGTTDKVAERIVGTKGQTYTNRSTGYIEGENPYKHDGERGGDVSQHADLVAGIRGGRPINEARQVAESTLTAIMGRMSAYTGRALKWDWAMKSSKLDLTPAKYELGELPVAPVAIPGQTPLV